MAPVNVDTRYTDSPFEWDALASKPNVELWAIRVPTDVSLLYLRAFEKEAKGIVEIKIPIIP